MSASHNFAQPVVISFSGLDGSGKTTQITALQEAAAHLGLPTTIITFWDDVVVGTRYREGFVHKVFGSEQGVGEPGKPVEPKVAEFLRFVLSQEGQECVQREGRYLPLTPEFVSASLAKLQ